MISVLPCLLLAATLPVWNFDATDTAPAWQANEHHADTRIEDEQLRTRTVGDDPILMTRGLQFETNPWQVLLIRMRADVAGNAALYWTGTNEPPYEGLSESKRSDFRVAGVDGWQEIAIYPGWQREGHIEKLRLDFYGPAAFAFDWIKVVDCAGGRTPNPTLAAQDLRHDPAWFHTQDQTFWLAPPLAVPAAAHGFLALELAVTRASQASVLWSTRTGTFREYIDLQPGLRRVYNLDVLSAPAWSGTIEALGLELPTSITGEIAVRLADAPQGPPQYVVDYMGFENAANRATQPATVLLQVRNTGGESAGPATVTWDLPGLSPATVEQDLDAPPWGEVRSLAATIVAPEAGRFPIKATLTADGATPLTTQTTLDFLPSLPQTTPAYIPPPESVPTAVDVLAYYFPGWATAAAWDPIRGTAPGRKPLLGYYDEANPEVVDWQIKWSLENGITGYLVDWYWTGGAQHLTHWFEAYRKARFRDQLHVAIMWANHNPPGSHSAEDWRAVTREWLDHYFTLPAYYRIDGMPAVFLWDPRNLRNDLGGSDAVRAALADSQAMARDAGYPGIAFVTLFGHSSESECAQLQAEGYHGITSYHEWGNAPALGENPRQMTYADVVATAPGAWASERARAGSLVYYPTIDTGWDARPWHGDAAQVISGRDVPGFRTLLQAGRHYAEAQQLPFVVLGPMNEWGEGSYIEPCTEFGFGMLEAIREVFATNPRAEWPLNLKPADIGRGPYDLPVSAPRTRWAFSEDTAGWNPMMNVVGFKASDGILQFASTSTDPALQTSLQSVQASAYGAFEMELRVTTEGAAGHGLDHAQLFWSVAGQPMLESTSLQLPTQADGAWHTYRFVLKEAPGWRGRISALRLDPSSQRDAQVAIRRMELLPATD